MTGTSSSSAVMTTEPLSSRLQVNGFDMHYWEWPGSDPTLVCLHPSGHYGRIWESVAQLLAPQFRVLALDQRGHGDSGQPTSGSSAQDYASDVAALIEARGSEKIVLVGHSLGARTAMVYAGLYPDRVSYLVLVGGPHYSTLQPGADVGHWQTNADTMRQRPRRVPSAEEAAAILRTSYPNFNEAAIQHALRFNTRPVAGGGVEWRFDPAWVADGLMHALDDLRDYAARIRCPVLILRPDTSWELAPERMPQVVAAFGAANVTTRDLSGSANLEVEVPHEVATAVREFVRA